MDADLEELFRAGLTTWDCQVLDDVSRDRVEWADLGGRLVYRRWWDPDAWAFCTGHMERLAWMGLVGRLDEHRTGGLVALTERGMLTLEAWIGWRQQHAVLRARGVWAYGQGVSGE